MLYHCIVNDCDSHNGNIMYDISANEIVLFDSSHIMDKEIHNTARELRELYLNNHNAQKVYESNKDIYNTLQFKDGNNLANELVNEVSIVTDKLSSEVVHSIIDSIPNEWREFGRDELFSIYEQIINYRVNNLLSISQELVYYGGY